MNIHEAAKHGFSLRDKKSGYYVSFKSKDMEIPFKIEHLQSEDWVILKDVVYKQGILTFDYIREYCVPQKTYFVTDRGNSPRLYVGFTRCGLLVTDTGFRGQSARTWREADLLNWRVATEIELIKLGLDSGLL